MSGTPHIHDAEHAERLRLHALHALPASEAAEMEAQVAACDECRRELEALRSVVGSFVDWPRPVIRPTTPLWDRLASRIASESGEERAAQESLGDDDWKDPPWKEARPGLTYKILSHDRATDRVTLLVTLEAGADYPPHVHADVEELYLLDGELWIDDRKLYPGDYNYGEPGGRDLKVWSETGCTCVLITSARDVLG